MALGVRAQILVAHQPSQPGIVGLVRAGTGVHPGDPVATVARDPLHAGVGGGELAGTPSDLRQPAAGPVRVEQGIEHVTPVTGEEDHPGAREQGEDHVRGMGVVDLLDHELWRLWAQGRRLPSAADDRSRRASTSSRTAGRQTSAYLGESAYVPRPPA